MKKILLSLLIAGVVQNSYAMQDDLQAADVGVAGSGQAAMLAASCAELAELSQENMQYAALLDAIVQNNIAAVQKMLTEGVSVFVVGPENTTLYQDVIDMPNVNPAILSILDQAASEVIPVDLVNQKVKTPYLVASSTANQLLKSNNGSINHPLLRRESATVLSLNDSLNHWQNIDMFEKLAEGDPLMLESFLSEKKLKLLLSSESGRKVFNRAFLIACGKLEFVANVNELVNISSPMERSSPSLHQAAISGDTILAQRLISAGADVNARDYDDRTALMNAVIYGHTRYGHTRIVPLLIAAGADVNARDYLDHTALFYAEQGGYTETARLLIAAGDYRNVGEAIHKFILKHPNLFKAATISAVAGIGYKIWQNSQK